MQTPSHLWGNTGEPLKIYLWATPGPEATSLQPPLKDTCKIFKNYIKVKQRNKRSSLK